MADDLSHDEVEEFFGEVRVEMRFIGQAAKARDLLGLDATAQLSALATKQVSAVDLLPTLLTPIREQACDDGATRKTLYDAVVDNVVLVIRGQEHLSNTLRQLMLYEAFGWKIPRFGTEPSAQPTG